MRSLIKHWHKADGCSFIVMVSPLLPFCGHWYDKANRGRVGGISLSPAFVVMYVMQHLQITWEDALHMVQNRRYCISPNGGFLTQIKVCLLSAYPYGMLRFRAGV